MRRPEPEGSLRGVIPWNSPSLCQPIALCVRDQRKREPVALQSVCSVEMRGVPLHTRHNITLVPRCAITSQYISMLRYRNRRQHTTTLNKTSLNKTSYERLKYGDTPIAKLRKCKFTPHSTPSRGRGCGCGDRVWGGGRLPLLPLPSLPPPLVGSFPHSHVERHLPQAACRSLHLLVA